MFLNLVLMFLSFSNTSALHVFLRLRFLQEESVRAVNVHYFFMVKIVLIGMISF